MSSSGFAKGKQLLIDVFIGAELASPVPNRSMQMFMQLRCVEAAVRKINRNCISDIDPPYN